MIRLARAIADQLRDPESTYAMPGAWWRQSLAHGMPGVALLHIELAAADFGPWQRAHDWLACAVRSPITSGADSHLYYGAPAVAHALACAATVRPGSYERALDSLDETITRDTHAKVDAAHLRIDRNELPQRREFELIHGLTGVGAHLLRRDPHSKTVRAVLEYLVRLTQPITDNGDVVPGWWVPTSPTGRDDDQFPGGHANFGMAHGITGPLALLALAARHGTTVDGHLDAMTRIRARLDQWRGDTATGPVWPYWINRSQLRTPPATPAAARAPSWCYGAAGLARAQQLAAHAVGDVAGQRDAEQALIRALADPPQLAATTDSSLCHGYAGLAHLALRVAEDAPVNNAAELRRLAMSLMDRLHAAGTDANQTAATLVRRAAGPGLLEGATGIALAALAATAGPPHSGWDTCLLTATPAAGATP
jgi:Lanthionine synthetase C-like protein